MTSYHQGDVNFYPLSAFGKTAVDLDTSNLLRTTEKRLLIQEGEITGHHHGVWFVPKPTMYAETGHGGASHAAAATEAVLSRAVRGELAPARLYDDPKLTESLGLDRNAPVIGFLVCDEDVVIKHASENGTPTNEHADIRLPRDVYLVTGKREWFAGDERRVAD